MIKLDGVWVGSINHAILEAEAAAAAESAPASQQEAPAAESEKPAQRIRAKKEVANGNDDVS